MTTKPKFANTAITSSRRPKSDVEQENNNLDFQENTLDKEKGERSIKEFMTQKMKDCSIQPTRPITLRFEDELWHKVEKLRGTMSKNDFFKELVNFYDSQNGSLY